MKSLRFHGHLWNQLEARIPHERWLGEGWAERLEKCFRWHTSWWMFVSLWWVNFRITPWHRSEDPHRWNLILKMCRPSQLEKGPNYWPFYTVCGTWQSATLCLENPQYVPCPTWKARRGCCGFAWGHVMVRRHEHPEPQCKETIWESWGAFQVILTWLWHDCK